jgi:hypothetical protein
MICLIKFSFPFFFLFFFFFFFFFLGGGGGFMLACHAFFLVFHLGNHGVFGGVFFI